MTRSKTRHSRGQSHNHGSPIPPDHLFGSVLPGRLILDAHLPFEERVERAWARLLAGFEEDDHERLREVLDALIEGERSGVIAAKESSP